MTQYRLMYFDFDGGRGEPIRIAMHAAGVTFEDVRISFADFPVRRMSRRFRAVPTLEIDGQQVSQSDAIGRYVGKLAGLYPDDNLQALYCDEVLGVVEDLYHYMVRSFGLEGDELKQAREALVDGWLTTILVGLDELLARGGGEFFAAGRLTMADLKVMTLVNSLTSGTLDHVPTDVVARLAAGLVRHRDTVAAHPVVRAYYAARSAD